MAITKDRGRLARQLRLPSHLSRERIKKREREAKKDRKTCVRFGKLQQWNWQFGCTGFEWIKGDWADSRKEKEKENKKCHADDTANIRCRLAARNAAALAAQWGRQSEWQATTNITSSSSISSSSSFYRSVSCRWCQPDQKKVKEQIQATTAVVATVSAWQ